MKQEKEVKEYKKILQTEFKRIKEELQTDEVKIDSKFIERYFGKILFKIRFNTYGVKEVLHQL